jgi:hypothetical protein
MVAETESQMKMKRLERDMPKFLRAQRAYVDSFNKDIDQAGGAPQEEEYQYKRETIEDMMKRQYDYGGSEKFTKYQPVLYEIVKDP